MKLDELSKMVKNSVVQVVGDPTGKNYVPKQLPKEDEEYFRVTFNPYLEVTQAWMAIPAGVK